MTFTNLLLAITATSAALMAGLFYTWTVSITVGLKPLSNREYISSFQSINREIQNLLFLIPFLGALVLLPVSTFLLFGTAFSFELFVVATICYVIGVFGVTMFGNIPLNNRLEAFDLKSATKNEIDHQRKTFESPWNRLNKIRTFFSILAFILVLIACINL